MRRGSTLTRGSQRLENLLPLAAYDSDETGYWRRRFTLCAVAFGAGMFIPELLTRTVTAFSPPVTVGLHATAGLLFAFLLIGTSRARVRLATAGLYSGRPRVIDPPPEPLIAYYQLPCTWVEGRILAGIGGVLYIGRKGLLFEADRRYLRAARRPAEVMPLDAVRLELADPIRGRPAFQRFLMPRPLKPIELSWNGSTARLYVPKPGDTIEVIRRRLETPRRIPQ